MERVTMYGSSQFDGSAAAFMGGGFMPTQSAHPPSDSSSISKNRETRCLFPLTVKQINNLASNDESNFIIDGAEVNNVTIVGRVSHKEDKASEHTFLVDDGTGQIECTKWVQESLDTEQMGEILVGMYVRVHGHLRGLQGRRFLNVFSIRPVTDFNEIPSHFIECIYVHFYNTRLRGVTAQPPVANSTSTPLKGYQAAPPYQSSVYSSADGLNNVSQMILNFLQQPAYLSTEGAHYDVIARQLNIPTNKLKEELQILVDNGLIYTTINDDYYKSTVNA
ncbi:replication family protein [Salix suchowensis]|uniref:REPLICATION PROTEIN A 32 kDa SUBUNIT A n=2 Tax=Salix TaxID=40685 RepID=A0A9Q1A5S5_9ROSI|nr:replication family protein [Salix suchowensis]KAJ6759345.1 REPLICATION PROTEIN A 32 KDA SUBUNIT A [Salix koriyanagi]